MPTLAELKAVTQTAEIDFYGIPVRVKYRPGAMTLRVERMLFGGDDSLDGEASRQQALEAFLSIIAEWDVTEADGETRVPISAETLEDIPREVLWDTLRRIGEAQARSKNGKSE